MDSDGRISMASPHGDELYIVQKRVGAMAYYLHNSASLDELPRLLADYLKR